MRDIIRNLVLQWSDGKVQAGPFAGMRILPDASWGDGDLTAKLLGMYEEELQDVLALAIANSPQAIVNIGCAEGFYAIGLALRCLAAPVYAFDSDGNARQLAQRNADLNGVATRVTIGGACTPDDLLALAVRHRRLLVVCDCEGFETTLFSRRDLAQALCDSDIIVECHDFLDPHCTPRVFAGLWETHLIEVIYSGGRDPNRVPILARFSDEDRWFAICEQRPKLMNWLFCRGRSS